MSWKLLGCVAAAALIAGCAQESDREADPVEKSNPEPAVKADGADKKPEAKATAKPAQASTEMTCTYPVKAGDTAKTIMDRFGDDAKLQTLGGPEGMEIPGVVLWDGDEKRSVEIGFEDEARTKLDFIRVYNPSTWTLAGLSTGDSLEKVAQVNGVPVTFYGFEWDYGGLVSNFNEGKLDAFGKCNVRMTLTYDSEKVDMPTSFLGDAEFTSDTENMPVGAITVYELGVGFPR